MRRSFSTASNTLNTRYRQLVEVGKVTEDARQGALVASLSELHAQLKNSDTKIDPQPPVPVLFDEARDAARGNPFKQLAVHTTQKFSLARQSMRRMRGAKPRGLYIWGSVGVGKSFCMDLFYDCCDDKQDIPVRGKRRVHFHEFMLDIHQRMHNFKKENPRGDALPVIAHELALQARLLCFDEFQVTDIADAMILKRLFALLFELDVVVVTTSNRPPQQLYAGGLNRPLFLPFIDLLHEHCDVHSMDSTHDYRRSKTSERSDARPRFLCLADGYESTEQMDAVLRRAYFDEGTVAPEPAVVPVMMGREVHAPLATLSPPCAWFTFTELCERPLGAADYLAICENYNMLIVSGVPQMSRFQMNEARRFIVFIDAVYESNVDLVLSAHVPLDSLFVGFDVQVESRDGEEERADLGESVWVAGEGGSSSSKSTTMIGKMEWSATGRMGVSLAEFSMANDTQFAFARAASRLVELQHR